MGFMNKLPGFSEFILHLKQDLEYFKKEADIKYESYCITAKGSFVKMSTIRKVIEENTAIEKEGDIKRINIHAINSFILDDNFTSFKFRSSDINIIAPKWVVNSSEIVIDISGKKQ